MNWIRIDAEADGGLGRDWVVLVDQATEAVATPNEPDRLRASPSCCGFAVAAPAELVGESWLRRVSSEPVPGPADAE
jgi:hypothetical protein